MLNLPPTLHPSSLKSTRQLDFSQPIVLDMGCSLTLPKSKKQKPSGLCTPSHKKQKTTSIHTINFISIKSSVRTEFNTNFFSGTKNIFRLYSGICKDKYPM